MTLRDIYYAYQVLDRIMHAITQEEYRRQDAALYAQWKALSAAHA